MTKKKIKNHFTEFSGEILSLSSPTNAFGRRTSHPFILLNIPISIKHKYTIYSIPSQECPQKPHSLYRRNFLKPFYYNQYIIDIIRCEILDSSTLLISSSEVLKIDSSISKVL